MSQTSTNIWVLDPRSGVPFYRQIVERVQLAVASGALESGDRLPTVRQLSVDLSVNPNTVARAYRELELIGTIISRRGNGTFVGPAKPERPQYERRRQLDRLCREVISQAQALGFSLDEFIDALTDFRPQAEAKICKQKRR